MGESRNDRLFKSKLNTFRPVAKFPYHDKDGCSAGLYYISHPPTLSKYCTPSDTIADIAIGVPGKRGWCLQKRYLPPHAVHYGDNQLHWECSTSICDETGNQEEATRGADIATSTRALLLSPNAADIPNKENSARKFQSSVPYGRRSNPVEDYANRGLTFERDRSPAPASLAKAYAYYMKGSYVAGLWAGDLAVGLLWFDQLEMSRRLSEARAPSRSWAKLEGLEGTYKRVGLVEVYLSAFRWPTRERKKER